VPQLFFSFVILFYDPPFSLSRSLGVRQVEIHDSQNQYLQHHKKVLNVFTLVSPHLLHKSGGRVNGFRK
jgi:hypothetical protein